MATRPTAAAQRLPFNLLSGFLGSGKSTLINALLRSGRLAGAAIVVNEIGDTGIDHLLLEAEPQQVALLSGGCLCCTLGSGLAEAMERLERRRRELGAAPFSRVLVETSGAVDPAPVVQSLLSDPALARTARLDSIIVTADVTLVAEQLGRWPESARQLALADRIVITKTDLADAGTCRAVRTMIAERFPAARICTRAQAAAQPGRLLGAGLFDPSRRVLRPERWLGNSVATRELRHSPDVSSFTVELASRPSWARLEAWLGTLLALQGENILRVKGFVHLEDHPTPVAVHAVHHRMHAPVDLGNRQEIPQQTVLVFVTAGLSRVDVLASLAPFGLAAVPAGGIAKRIDRIA